MNDAYSADAAAGRWLRRFFLLLALLAALTLLIAMPVSGLWLYRSGDLAVNRAVEAQSAGFALYGTGLDGTAAGRTDAGSGIGEVYKLALYRAREPQIVLAGSSGMGMLRDSVFSRPMVNMAGTASSLSTLRESLDAMLAEHRPDVVLLALDFWWFSDAWEADPFVRRTTERQAPGMSPEALRMPLQSLLQGKIGLGQFLFMGFRDNRYGMRAQFADEGYGPDGSWYAGAGLSEPRAADAGFMRTLDRVRRQIGEFAPQKSVSTAHLDAFADIYFRLRGRGITPLVFLAPLPGPVLDEMKKNEAAWPHLFNLRRELEARGIPMTDTSDPRYLDADSCEFLDGLHGGEVAAIRILRDLTSSWNGLLSYVNMEQCNRLIAEWKGHASIRYEQVKDIWESDFLELGCLKKTR
ncbi:MAG: hypothetical protein Q4F72_05815 [Desulfovibrionaceae bacterium]|nr:hypothetical protein [Desulfovibrionaceae bacterium]